MSEENNIKIEPTNIDLNSLFNLTYTFDNLKLLIGNLKKNQDLIFSLLNENNKNNKEIHDYQEDRFKSIEEALNKIGGEIKEVKRPSIDEKYTNIQTYVFSDDKDNGNKNEDEPTTEELLDEALAYCKIDSWGTVIIYDIIKNVYFNELKLDALYK